MWKEKGRRERREKRDKFRVIEGEDGKKGQDNTRQWDDRRGETEPRETLGVPSPDGGVSS